MSFTVQYICIFLYVIVHHSWKYWNPWTFTLSPREHQDKSKVPIWAFFIFSRIQWVGLIQSLNEAEGGCDKKGYASNAKPSFCSFKNEMQHNCNPKGRTRESHMQTHQDSYQAVQCNLWFGTARQLLGPFQLGIFSDNVCDKIAELDE